MAEHPYGWLSLLPPLLVIVLAILSRRIIFSLLVGIAVGAFLLRDMNVVQAADDFVNVHLWEAIINPDRLMVFAFTLLMGAMIGIINHSGAMRDLVERISKVAKGSRSGQLTTWFLGLFVFFDDYANTLLLGTSMRGLCDKLCISREKLAYIVDSTAAPVAGLALISTWVAVEVDFVNAGLEEIGAESTDNSLAFGTFVKSIPYRFYIIWALLFVPMVAIVGREFGPMYKAEQNAENNFHKRKKHSRRHSDPEEMSGSWINVVFPIIMTVAAIVWFIYVTGAASLRDSGNLDPPLYLIFGNCDPYASLLWGALFGFLFTIVMILAQGSMKIQKMISAAADGASSMVPALLILWLASSLSAMTGSDAIGKYSGDISNAQLVAETLKSSGQDNRDIAEYLIKEKEFSAIATAAGLADVAKDKIEVEQLMLANGMKAEQAERAIENPHRNYRLYTSDYLAGLLTTESGEDRVPVEWMPTIIFVLAGFIAFSTGSSWGTMGIVVPLAITVTGRMLMGDSSMEVAEIANNPIMLGAVGAVLAGAIFGDHCSPISDTTVLSSQASGCDHMAHVVTQLPYALLVGVISIVCGTIPIGFGVPVYALLPVGLVVMLASLYIFGKRIV